MKHILVPTDFSDCANAANGVALHIAQRHRAELHYLHALDTVQDWAGMPMLTADDARMPPTAQANLYPEVKQRIGVAQMELEKLVKNAGKAGVTGWKEIGYNMAHEEITTYAHDKKIDLIVLGSHGASGFKEAFIGSNAQRVVRYAKCPVLTVKTANPNFSIKNIVFAADFSEEAANANIARCAAFAQSFDARLHLVFINTPNYFEATATTESRMEALAKEFGLTNYTVNIYNDFTYEDGIIAFAKRTKADVIGLTTHGFTGMRRWISNNVTETLVNHANTPVLSFNLPG